MHFAQCSKHPKILLQINLDYHEKQRKLLFSIVEKLPNRNHIELLIENGTMDSSLCILQYLVKFFKQKCMCAKMTYEIKDKTNRNKLMIGTSSTSQL